MGNKGQPRKHLASQLVQSRGHLDEGFRATTLCNKLRDAVDWIGLDWIGLCELVLVLCVVWHQSGMVYYPHEAQVL